MKSTAINISRNKQIILCTEMGEGWSTSKVFVCFTSTLFSFTFFIYFHCYYEGMSLIGHKNLADLFRIVKLPTKHLSFNIVGMFKTSLIDQICSIYQLNTIVKHSQFWLLQPCVSQDTKILVVVQSFPPSSFDLLTRQAARLALSFLLLLLCAGHGCLQLGLARKTFLPSKLEWIAQFLVPGLTKR